MTAQLVDLTARRRQADRAVARVASAPVRYVPEAFLLALECRDEGDEQQWTWRLAPVTPLRPVAAAR